MNTAGDETVRRVLDILKTGRGEVLKPETERMLARAEPIARRACRAHLRWIREEVLDELVQHTLIIASEKMDSVRADDGPGWDRWVRGVARHVCRNDVRRKRDLLTEDGVVEVTDTTAGSLLSMLDEERDAVVRDAILRLPKEEQSVVYYRYVHDLSRKEIAARLSLGGVDAVRAILVRAQRHLRDLLVEELGRRGHSPSADE